jgi:hypothetical protein
VTREDLTAPIGAAPAISRSPDVKSRTSSSECNFRALDVAAGPYIAPTGADLPSVLCEPTEHVLSCWCRLECMEFTEIMIAVALFGPARSRS